jgi:hypothetical protein
LKRASASAWLYPIPPTGGIIVRFFYLKLKKEMTMRHYSEYPDDSTFNSATRRQHAFMQRHGIHPDRPIDLYEAASKIGTFIRNCRHLAPSAKQEKFLKDRGKWREGMNRGEAFDTIQGICAGLNTGP